ncbi:hypothetical protein ACJ41O_009034 [Fusarium nematophilum]
MASLRRSARIRNIEAQEGMEPPKPAPVEPPECRKRKYPGVQKDVTGSSKRTKIPPIRKTKAKGKGSDKVRTPQPVPAAPDDALSVLPAEILQMILDNITDAPVMLVLARTSKRNYSIVMPILHKRVAIAVAYHAHIPKAIRAIKPHLSIAQKKQLKKEGKYKGQQEKFSIRLDSDSIPVCADYVRQLVIGSVDPGKKHKYIVIRYLEELFKNLHNLEAVDTMELSEPMSHCLVSQKNLRALSLYPLHWQDETLVPLASIGRLEHLRVESRSCGTLVTTNENLLQSILLNLMSTLQSLDIQTTKYHSDFLADWEDQVKTRDPDSSRRAHDFTALKSLSLYGIQFHGQWSDRVIPNFTRAFDFLRLRELKLSHLENGKLTFFKHLETLFGSAHKPDIHLRSLCLQMMGDDHGQSYRETELQLEGIYRFICSFDTLTNLDLVDYNAYTDKVDTSLGLSTRLQQSIIKHKGLRKLKIRYGGMNGNWNIPYVSAETIAVLIKKLPQLQELEFAPEEKDIDDMARALAHGKNLTTLKCGPHPSQFDHSHSEHPSLPVFKAIIKGFLSNASNTGDFVWENHYKLRQMTVGWRLNFDIASEFGKPRKNMKEPIVISDGGRQVMCQDPRQRVSPMQYGADCSWVEEVASTLS